MNIARLTPNLPPRVISREHFGNYLKLREESEFHRMSYAEKRRKDRDFGRYLKSAKKALSND